MTPGKPMRIGSTGRWPTVPHWRRWSITYWLIAINIGIYIADLLTGGRLTAYGAFTGALGVYHFQLWRWVSYQFLHASPAHLLFNMFALYTFGPVVESALRRGTYVAFYLLSGIGGVLGYLILWRMRFLHVSADTSLVGASACIFGLIAAAAKLSPDTIVSLMWPPVRFRLVTLAWVFIGLAVLTIIVADTNAGGEAAHLGGAVAGFILIRNTNWFSVPSVGQKRRRFWQPGDPASNFFRNEDNALKRTRNDER